jgi:hypothetical protein
MLINLEEQIGKLRDVRSGKIKEGLKLGVPQIDEWMRFKPSDFTIVVGHANVGKTSVVMYLMLLYTLKHDLKWLIFSSENDTDSFNERVKWVNERFKFIDTNKLYTSKELMELAQHVKNAWSYDGFMIDPYNSLIKDRNVLKGISGHEYDYEVTSEMRIFCKRNNVSIWLNTHAATEALRKKHPQGHPYAEHPIPPMASDVEGGGKFVNRCDNMMSIHRYVSHPSDWMYTHIHIKKVKNIDTGGRPTPLDNPIKLKSILNNVGFEVNHQNLIPPQKLEQKEMPF